PRATYVFTDLDRLSLWGLRLAASAYRRLRDQEVTVLNDPARVLSRYGLLRRLYLSGINAFNAYRVEEGVIPERWPVFLRCEGDHNGPLCDLLHSMEEVHIVVAGAVARGLPLPSLLIVEFAAQPVRPGLYRKLASFRIGKATFAHTCVHDDHWVAKAGKMGIATPELYEDEFRIARDDPYAKELAAAFDIAGIDYGRVDFGLVDGKVQVYEINLNPAIQFDETHPVPIRMESYALFKRNYLDALYRIDSPDDQGIVTIW
ncbi:MAG: hypothetical protein ACRD1G_16050, partial [Acidimicrobiales bacterium]